MQSKHIFAIVLTVIGLFILWMGLDVFAAAFLGLLFATAIVGLGQVCNRYLHLPLRVANLLVIVVILSVLTGMFWLAGPQLFNQVNQVIEQMPQAIEDARGWLHEQPFGDQLLAQFDSMDDGQGLGLGLVNQVSSIFSVTLATIGLIVVITFVALLVTVDPWLYYRGFLLMIPQAHEDKAREVLHYLGVALRWWMVGRLSSMVIVGIFTGLGLWLIGMPAPVALGLFAGVLSFVPNIGPVLSAVPGLLLAIPLGPGMVFWALTIYVGVQAVESNLITPMIQQYAVSVPAAILIVVQILLSVVAGVWGLLIATPLCVVVMVLLQQLYIRDYLGKSVSIAGQHTEAS